MPFVFSIYFIAIQIYSKGSKRRKKKKCSSSNKIVDYLSIAKDEVKKENDVADAAVPGSMFPEGIMNAIQMYMW